MDCSIVPTKYPELHMVSTTDFFYPLVEDPYAQGKIACANVVSDMYALGVVDIDNLLMLLSVSMDMTMGEQDVVTKLLMQGFSDQAAEAGTEVTGGQTVKNPWVIIGGVAQSACMESDFIRPEHARSGDVLVLTKALGTQVAVNAHQWLVEGNTDKLDLIKDVLTHDEIMEAYDKATQSMMRLNRNAAKLMHTHGAHAATDVTGFGILGHANNLAMNQSRHVKFELHTLPCIKHMLAVNEKVSFGLHKGGSAETSGGLLVALPEDVAQTFCDDLWKLDGVESFIVGRVLDAAEDEQKHAYFAEDMTHIEV